MALDERSCRLATRRPCLAKSSEPACRLAHHGNVRARLHLLLSVGLCVSLAACSAGRARGAPQAVSGGVAARADQLAMRDPDRFHAPSSALSTGGLQRSGASLRGMQRTPASRESRATLTPIRLAQHPRPRPYPLRDGELVLSSGLVVHRVPKGITVRSAREQQTGDVVLEIADAHGRRLALLKERTFRRAAAASVPVLDQTATTTLEAHRNDWGRTPVRVIVDRFRAEHHIYTLERRASGTSWIMSNLELGSRATSRREHRAE